MSHLTLTSLALHELELQLRNPLRTSQGLISTRRTMLVECEFDVDGQTANGVGEAAPLPGWGSASYEDCREALSDLSGGAHFDVYDISAIFPALEPVPPARFAFEVAALDALTQTRDIPMASFLAGDAPANAEVAVNATIGAMDAAEAVEEARAALGAGFRCIKVKVGADSLEDDLARVSKVRAFVGDTVAIRLDANGAWSEKQALGALEALAPHSIEYVEQPVAADELDALTRLSQDAPVAVAADESAVPRERAWRIVRDELVDVLVLKPMVLGGLLPALELADAAHHAGISVTLTSSIESAVGRTAVAHAAGARQWMRGPHGLATGGWFAEDVATEGDPIRDGVFFLERAPGLGRDLRL